MVQQNFKMSNAVKKRSTFYELLLPWQTDGHTHGDAKDCINTAPHCERANYKDCDKIFVILSLYNSPYNVQLCKSTYYRYSLLRAQ